MCLLVQKREDKAARALENVVPKRARRAKRASTVCKWDAICGVDIVQNHDCLLDVGRRTNAGRRRKIVKMNRA